MPMKRVNGSLPNLVNGVSQQAPALRLATQAEAQTNQYSTIVEGLKDRAPTEWVAKVLDAEPASVFTHIINRDLEERYIVVIDATTEEIRVFDFAGDEKTVNAPDGWDYLTGTTDIAKDIRALTVADYTFISNVKKETAMDDTDTEPERNPEALINVLAGNYGKTYTVTIDGVQQASFSTPDGSSAAQSFQIDTVYIASEIAADLAANGFDDGVDWQTTRYGNAVHLESLSGTNFTISVEDGYNGNAMKAAKTRVQKFSDLPAFGPNGFVCEIVGDAGNDSDNYWVKLETSESGSGIWRECVKPETVLTIDGLTMPHTLIRETDGTFTFQPAEWDPRKCGDGDEIAPDPSFIGSTIEDIFFHRNRLGFLTDENAVMSRNGSFFDFFRTTATALLDDDPIDVAASHVKVSFLKHAVPFNDDLLMFSEQTEFVLKGNELLTAKTVSARPRSEYISDGGVSPLALGESVFFTAKRDSFSSVWEYAFDDSSGPVVAKANEVTSHVPAYIPEGVFKIVGTSNENVLVLATEGDPSAVYVYKFYWSGNQKLQSSWSRWEFPGATRILNIEFVDSNLYLVIARSDGVYLEKIKMQPNATDLDMDFVVHLDRRIHSDDLAAPSYDSGTDKTTFTLPYTPDDDIVAVTAPGGDTDPAQELEWESINAGAKTVIFDGDRTGDKMWFGWTYERRYRFSRFYVRQQSQSGGSSAVQSGRLQIRHMVLSYDKAAYFRVEVTPEGRETYTYPFTGRVLGAANNILGTVPLRSGKKSIPILSRNDRVVVDIVNDSWMPSAFISVEWYGTLAENARER